VKISLTQSITQMHDFTCAQTREWSHQAVFWNVPQFELRLSTYGDTIHPLIKQDIEGMPRSWCSAHVMRCMIEIVEKDVTGEGMAWWVLQEKRDDNRRLDKCLA
jgi:hypothetical protein